MSDDEINEGPGVEWIKNNLMGESLDWLVLGDPMMKIDRLREFDSPLREAGDLVLLLRAAVDGGATQLRGGDEALVRVADMASDRIGDVVSELDGLYDTWRKR